MILSYHNIAETKGHYTVTTENFKAQLAYLAARYRIVSLPEYVGHLIQTGRSHPEHVVLTFDDAFQSFADIVLPLLKAQAIPAALFVPTAFLGKTDLWNPLPVRFPIMDAQTLKEVALFPEITIGSHTVSHPSLATLSPALLEQELTESKATLERLLEKEVSYLAYPFGQPHIDFNARVLEAVKKAGYKAALGTSFHPSNKKENLFALNRLTIESHYTLPDFENSLRANSLRAAKQRIKNLVSALRYR